MTDMDYSPFEFGIHWTDGFIRPFLEQTDGPAQLGENFGKKKTAMPKRGSVTASRSELLL